MAAAGRRAIRVPDDFSNDLRVDEDWEGLGELVPPQKKMKKMPKNIRKKYAFISDVT